MIDTNKKEEEFAIVFIILFSIAQLLNIEMKNEKTIKMNRYFFVYCF
jgi:hypothetical protein